MESSYLVVFSVVASCLLLLSVLITLILLARIHSVDDRQDLLEVNMAERAVPKQLEKALATAESSRDRIDNAVLELGKFKDGVHGEMQRFYAIMRRNEKAAGFVQGQQAGQPDVQEHPDEIPAASLGPTADETEPISKADLRKQARAAGL